MNGKRFSAFFTVVMSVFFLLSCGIEDIPYVDKITTYYKDVNSVTIQRLPLPSSEGYSTYFSHFIIFYRIYVAGENANLTGRIETSDLRSLINPVLNSDYNSFYSLTDTINNWVNTSNLENTFYSRRYYKLELAGVNINNLLSSSSLGQSLTIAFPTANTGIPTLTLGSAQFNLLRAVVGQGVSVNPQPSSGPGYRYFQNDSLLFNDAPTSFPVPSGTNNADAVGRTATTPPSRYTYVSMYIAAVGRDVLTTIYSQPSFLGIFKLPDSWN